MFYDIKEKIEFAIKIYADYEKDNRVDLWTEWVEKK